MLLYSVLLILKWKIFYPRECDRWTKPLVAELSLRALCTPEYFPWDLRACSYMLCNRFFLLRIPKQAPGSGLV
jgi:hypothetical protein